MVSVPLDVPKELIKALGKGSFSLLIKGLAGTGKTTLALEVVRKICRNGTGYYISTRISSKKLYKQFPWIRNAISEKNIIDAIKSPIPSSMPIHISLEYVDEPSFLKSLYEKIEMAKKKPVTVVIDSLEALKANLNISSDNMRIERKLLDVGETTNSNMIFVSESSGYIPLDYLVDGVVTLTREIIHGRLVRKIILEKIRGEEIKKPTFLFTLKDGRFIHFRDEPLLFPEEVIRPPLISSSKRISTGIKDLNDLIAGGFQRGSFNLFEVGSGVGAYYLWILCPFAVSLIQHKIPVIIIPPSGELIDAIRMWILPFVGEKDFNTYVRFMEFEKFDKSSYIIKAPRKGEEFFQTILSIAASLRKTTESEFVAVIAGVDTFEHTFGERGAHDILSHLSTYSRSKKFLIMTIAKYGQKLIRSLNHMATTHFVLENIEGTTVIYGIIPRTEMYAVTVSTKKGYIETNLIPIE